MTLSALLVLAHIIRLAAEHLVENRREVAHVRDTDTESHL